MPKKPKVATNKAEDLETKNKERSKNLAAELGELTFQRAKLNDQAKLLNDQLNKNATKSNQIATQMEALK